MLYEVITVAGTGFGRAQTNPDMAELTTTTVGMCYSDFPFDDDYPIRNNFV